MALLHHIAITQRNLSSGLLSLLAGLRVTWRTLFRDSVTVEYPREQINPAPAYRSCIEFVRFEATGTHDCVACNSCVRACPSNCIVVEGEKPEGLKKKRATLFNVDFALCSLCGLCIDACPTDTLRYSRRTDTASSSRSDFVYDLLADFRATEPAYLEAERARLAAAEAAKARAAAEKQGAAQQNPDNGPANPAPAAGAA